MPRFAANLTLMFNEVDFLDRFEAAARAGFRAVEYLFPYPYEPGQIVERLQKHGLVQALHNTPAGDWAAGDRGIACQPARRGEFQDGIEKAIHYATTLGCKQVNCLAGVVPPGVTAEAARETLVANFKFAADKLGQAGIRVLIEGLNTRDVPGFAVCRSRQQLEVIDAVGSANVSMLYDVYHMQIMEGDLAPTIERLLPRIAHLQVADNPGRHEPGTGEVHYPFLFSLLDRLGYDGWIGCEYRPAGETTAGLGWLKAYLQAA